MNIFTNFFKSSHKTVDDYKAEIRQDFLRKEIEIVQDIFGPLKEGNKRDFYCLDEHTWIWYEEWGDEQGHRRHMTTRYDVQPSGITKSQNGGTHQELSAKEAQSLKAAVKMYIERVEKQLYARYV